MSFQIFFGKSQVTLQKSDTMKCHKTRDKNKCLKKRQLVYLNQKDMCFTQNCFRGGNRWLDGLLCAYLGVYYYSTNLFLLSKSLKLFL